MNFLDFTKTIPDKIRKVLEEFVNKFRCEVDPNAKIYLFGSYARGTWLSDSDLDLIIVSEKFRGLKIHERYALTRNLLPADISVELLLYTPEEFEKLKKKSIILQDAAEYWIEL